MRSQCVVQACLDLLCPQTLLLPHYPSPHKAGILDVHHMPSSEALLLTVNFIYSTGSLLILEHSLHFSNPHTLMHFLKTK